ncbi:DUF4239 domain-containing protein [Siculibacillus lacustris]|uniref:DUF4239 domain-containing protein n=1 Tax=Siculibacillus lacustris TaxID=1549641 RepID=A0A4Q9VV59_9HYPH|nr:DUF4239 domain-containing protein [Siculibacillus lacustris]TBW40108.1 DUF4239 domain-containing protein [Siculibacillus lacustris]
MSQFLASASDLQVLLVIAGLSVMTALIVAELASRLFFAPRVDEVERSAKLLDLVHSSLLAFIAFMLAISVADVRGNFGKADDAVSREAMNIAAFDREIGEHDIAWATPTRALLARYVATVAEDEWPRLAMSQPSLSPRAQAILDDLRGALRTVPAQEGARGNLLVHHDRLELSRIARYENATRSIPKVFWLLIGGFLFGAMVMNGRHRPTTLTRSLVGIHFAAIGMCIALILILDAPFRGETSIAPAPLVEALRHG